MQPESEKQRKAKMISEKLEEIMSHQPFRPITKFNGVTGIIIIRLKGDEEAKISLIGQIYPSLVLEAVINALLKAQQIAEGAENKLAT
jgi:hypothetical protein